MKQLNYSDEIIDYNNSALSSDQLDAPVSVSEIKEHVIDDDEEEIDISNIKRGEKATNVTSTQATTYDFNRPCFKARTNIVSPSQYHKLPRPFINLGFPKVGSTAMYKYFQCGGVKSSHYYCRNKDEADRYTCASCLKNWITKPSLASCGEHKFQVYAQLDNGLYFPQIELLDEIMDEFSSEGATFFLIFRNMDKWHNSLSHWPPKQKPKLLERFTKLNITGLPRGKGSHVEELSDWFCNHVDRVRRVIDANTQHTLVEIDLEEDENVVGQRMEDMFGIEQSCWKKTNANTAIASS